MHLYRSFFSLAILPLLFSSVLTRNIYRLSQNDQHNKKNVAIKSPPMLSTQPILSDPIEQRERHVYPPKLLNKRIPPPVPLPNRNFMVLGNGWALRFVWNEISPSASAAVHYFYQELLRGMQAAAAPPAGMTKATLKMKSLHLVFQSNAPAISLELMQWFVEMMLEITARGGFAGRFLAQLYYEPAQTMVHVGLGIVLPALPAESTGSN